MDEFEELYGRHQADVRRFALFLTGDSQRADDIVAEVFFRAWRAKSRIRHQTIRAYLLTIARNVYRDQRRAMRMPSVPLDYSLADTRPSTHTQVESAWRLRSVLANLSRVSRGDRRALVLHTIRELSYSDVARLLGVSVGAVKSRIARAREVLRHSPASASSTTGDKP